MCDYSKSDRKQIRNLSGVAHDRLLRAEFSALRAALDSLDAGEISPTDMNQQIHDFHNGISRELFKRFSGSVPEFSVFRAYFDGTLTDDDFNDASDNLRNERDKFIAIHAKMREDA